MTYWQRLDAFARPGWTVLVPGIVGAMIRLALLPWLSIPYPATHDEFSYLLGADTFAHGRLTNPTHPLWQFFETFHTLSIPTYASKYPPGQAFFLAIGERFFGHPFFGVLLTYVLFVSAIVWMLRAWTPAGVAFVGGAFAAVAFGAGMNWLESYMGSNVGATGAALVLGALGRMRADGHLRLAWVFAIGVVMLWFTRPYEGGVFVLVVCTVLFIDLVKRRLPVRGVGPFVAALAVCGAATLAFQGVYDARVTGKATLLPYALHTQEYEFAPLFWPMSPRTPTLNANPVVQHFNRDFELAQYRNLRNLLAGHFSAIKPVEPDAPKPGFKDRLKALEWIAGLAILAVFAVRYRRDPAVRLLSLMTVASALPMLLETYTSFRYLVAVVPLLIALTFRILWLESERAPVRVAAALGALFLVAAGNNAFRILHAIRDPFPLKVERSHVERELAARSGRQVVFVHYEPTHGYLEWVFNSADIDGQHVVWARDLGTEQDQRLMDYYQGSQFWLLDADAPRPEPVPYR